jgi:hypothetical protein
MIAGAAQKGPLAQGSTITVQELDSALHPTGTTFITSTSDDLGTFGVAVELTSPYVEIVAQGFYFDELSGGLSPAPLTLHALAAVQSDTTLYVNPLTDLEAPRIRALVAAGSSFDSARSTAESDVLAALAMPLMAASPFDTLTIIKDGDPNAVLLAVSVLVEQFAHYADPTAPVAELSSVLAKMGTLIATDGNLRAFDDWFVLRCSVPATIDVSGTATRLAEHYQSLGDTVTIPDFGRFLVPPAACFGDAGVGGADAGGDAPLAIPNTSCQTAMLCPTSANTGGLINTGSCVSLRADPSGADQYFVFVSTATGVQIFSSICGSTYAMPVTATVDVLSSCVGDGGMLIDAGEGDASVPDGGVPGRQVYDGGDCPHGESDLPSLPPGVYWVRFSGMQGIYNY